MIKLLIGGSPCTYWSVAQKNNRETTAEGMGWELFNNYLIAKEKFKPDFFLYENNKSAAQAIKDQIAAELNVGFNPQTRFTYINSALVSAQNRERFYVTNFGDIEQPEDRGILLRDILESGTGWQDKSYALTTRDSGAIPSDTLKRHRHTMIAEPVNFNTHKESNTARVCRNTTAITNKGRTLIATSYKGAGSDGMTVVAVPIDDFEYVDYNPRKHSHIVINENAIRCAQDKNNASVAESFVNFTDKKIGTLTTAHVPKCIEIIDDESNEKTIPIYEVCGGFVTIKEKKYPIKLADGYYIIRKLTVKECCRLQTMPDDYMRAVSATQGYKGLGNGWTAEVIIHLLKHAKIPLDEQIVVLSMYDGIGTGRYCLDKMGYKNVTYFAYEIDKYAMQVAQSNYPDIIQCGDAFQVRDDAWNLQNIRNYISA